jgi:adenylate cyclase
MVAVSQTSCATCGTEPRAGARFCDACGSPITPVGPQSEHKQVTVLFADVVRSMDLASRLDSERLREVMSELFNRCGAIVARYGGTVDKFTGDGIMAIFGAPIALEDHAARACLSALEIQREVRHLASDVHRRDGVEYALRVGLNSGAVVTGQIGVDPTSYTAVGAQVGLAQRMESVAPAGGVMVSESTARLVAHTAVLGDPQMVEIKGSDSPVPARLLCAMGPRRWPQLRHESALIGRDSEINSITALLDDAIAGHGHVVTVCGPPGIGKSRISRELADLADARDVKTYSTFCESHARDIPFHAVARLLRDIFGVNDLDDVAARGRIRARLASADPEDVQLLEELLGVGDPAAGLQIPADARRRRLSRLVASTLSARQAPAVLIVEDAHWTDDVTEAMLAEVLAVVPQTSSIAMITYRPEYRGPLHALPAATRFVLAPLDDSQAATLTAELMGSDPSLGSLTVQIIERAAGNPFFVHEIVRDLAERKIIDGDAGAYVRHGELTAVAVPPTLQAAIASRIDRLTGEAKLLLNAAAVIGSQFPPDLLATALEKEQASIQSALSEVVHAELIYPVVMTSSTEYAFRHPMIRTVAEESQLKSGRSALHRRLADALEQRNQKAGDENAALIASHLEAAGDLREAFGWYMRAGSWLTNRDLGAARTNWERARQIADRLPADEPDRITMRIAPRSLLCGSTWRAGGSVEKTGFDELRQLCSESSSQVPLLMGMAGLISSLCVHGRIREAAELTPEYIARIDSVGDRTLTVALLFAAIFADRLAGKMRETQRLVQRVIDLADGDATMGNVLTGSPLAFATAMRAIARCCLGEDGWRADFDAANTIAHGVDPTTFVSTVMFKYVTGIALGALEPDAKALAETAEALDIAHRYSEDMALGLAQLVRGMTLIHGGDAARRSEGFTLLGSARGLAVRERFTMTEVSIIDVETAAESARRGDVDAAIGLAAQVLDDLDRSGGVLYRGAATTVLVTSLLQRRAEGDLARVQAAITRLASAPADEGSVMHELPLLRLRALQAQARDDNDSYRELVDRYRSRSNLLGFEAHIRYASAMT